MDIADPGLQYPYDRLRNVIVTVIDKITESGNGARPGTMFRLERVRDQWWSRTRKGLDGYRWETMVRLLAPDEYANLSEDGISFQLLAKIPGSACGSERKHMILSSQDTFMEWLVLIDHAIANGVPEPGKPNVPQLCALRLTLSSPPGEAPRPSPPDGEVNDKDAEPEAVADKSDEPNESGILQGLYNELTVQDEDVEAFKSFFQLQDVSTRSLTTKGLPGMSPGFTILPAQLTGVFKYFKDTTNRDNGLRGMYLADKTGTGKTLLTVIVVVICRHAELMAAHLKAHPDMHHHQKGNDCPLSSAFGLQCVCVKGGLMERIHAFLPTHGCTEIILKGTLVEQWAAVFSKHVGTTISDKNHPCHGKPFLHVFTCKTSSNKRGPMWEAVDGCDGENKDELSWDSFKQLIPVDMPKADHIVISSISKGDKATKAFEAGKTLQGRHYLKPDEYGLRGGNGHVSFGAPGKREDDTLLDSGTVLLVSRSALETLWRSYNSANDDDRKGSIQLPLPTMMTNAKMKKPRTYTYWFPMTFRVRVLVVDEADERVSEDTVVLQHASIGASLSSSEGVGGLGKSPFLLFASATPFHNSISNAFNCIKLLYKSDKKGSSLRESLEALERHKKSSQSQDAERRPSPAEVKDALQTCARYLKKVMFARATGSTLLRGVALEKYDPEYEVLYLRYHTPEIWNARLQALKKGVRDNMAKGNVKDNVQTLSRLWKSTDYIAMLRAACVPNLLQAPTAGGNAYGDYAYPHTTEDIKKDLPPGIWKLGNANKKVSACPGTLKTLAESAQLATDPWFAALAAICRASWNGIRYDHKAAQNPDGSGKSEDPRHVVVFTPFPVVTVVVFLFLSHILGDIAECHLLTGECPSDITSRTSTIAGWAQNAERLAALPPKQRKIVICVVNVDIASTGIDNLKFASVGVFFGEPETSPKREQALGRLVRRGATRKVYIYNLERRDNAAFNARLDSNQGTTRMLSGYFDEADDDDKEDEE